MPLLMLPALLERKWLDISLLDARIPTILDYEMPAASLEYWPVKSLYRADSGDAALITAFDYDRLEAITR